MRFLIDECLSVQLVAVAGEAATKRIINQVLEVDLDGDEATFTFYELPSPE